VIIRRAQKEFFINEDGRSLKRGLLVELLVMRQRACTIGPRSFELCNVGTIDLRCRGVACPTAVVAVIGPTSVWPGLRAAAGDESQN
jgi:hypothetical protein